MSLSRKCQYGLRAVFELARRHRQGPVSIPDIASVQAVPPRFLEQILSQLKQAGFVESRRGNQGGYLLTVAPERLTVGQIVRFFEGELSPVRCLAGPRGRKCPLLGNCVFQGLWDRVRQATENVYDSTTFRDLVTEEAARAKPVSDYCI